MPNNTIEIGKVHLTSTPMAFYEPYITAEEVAETYDKKMMPVLVIIHPKSGDDKVQVRKFHNKPLTEERIKTIATTLNSLIRSAVRVEARILGTDEQIAK